MHAFEAKGGTVFHHNSDLSGEVIVANKLGEEVRVGYEDLREFVKRKDAERPREAYKAPSPSPQFQERLRQLPATKAMVCVAIEALRLKLDDDGKLTPWGRQMFDVALNSVKGAR